MNKEVYGNGPVMLHFGTSSMSSYFGWIKHSNREIFTNSSSRLWVSKAVTISLFTG